MVHFSVICGLNICSFLRIMWESLLQLYVKFIVGYFQNELEGLFDNL